MLSITVSTPDVVGTRMAGPGIRAYHLACELAKHFPTTLIAQFEDFALTERSMTGTEQYVAGEWRYERIEGAGHWMMLDAPDTVNSLLLDFIGSHARAGAAVG